MAAVLSACWPALPAASGTSPSKPAAAVDCRDVILRTGDGSIYTRTRHLRARRTDCRTARRVARRYLHGSEGAGDVRPYGYRCTARTTRVTCRRGNRQITWHW